MKNTLRSLFSLLMLSFAFTAFAQPPAGGFGGRGGMNMDPEQRAERQATMMKDSLMLTDDLTAEVKAVLLVYAKKMQDARSQADGDWDAMRGAMQTLRKEQDEELQAMIGDEKWTRWEAIRGEMMQRGPRGPREGGPEQRQPEQGGKKKKKDTKTE